MNDAHFKRLTEGLRLGAGQIRTAESAANSLRDLAARRRRVLAALQRLAAGPTRLPTARRPNVFFIGATEPTEAPQQGVTLLHGATYRRFWATTLVTKTRKLWEAKELDAVGEPSECLMTPCAHCAGESPVIGMDPPLSISIDGIALSCGVFTLCMNCPRIAQVADEILRERISLDIGLRQERKNRRPHGIVAC